MSDTFLPELDNAFSALVEDLESRGILQKTLVIATGEFGRTPEINNNLGRDHWANAFSMCIAGAGVPGGQIHGETDENGAYVTKDPVEIPDFCATIYDKLGIDYTKEYVNPLGRPTKLAADGAKPLTFLYS